MQSTSTLTPADLAHRLKAAREACGLTQKEVAAKIGVSRSTLAQMELAKRAVTSLELKRIAHLYGYDLRSLLADDFQDEEPLAALFRSQPDFRRHDAFLDAIRGSLELGRELASLEKLLGIDRDVGLAAAYPLQLPASKWEAIEQGQRVASEERRRLGLGTAPIANLAELLEGQGLRTAQIVLPEDISGLTVFESTIGTFVVANKAHPYERRRFSYAHEYAHALLDRRRPGVVSRSSDRHELVEIRANAFAASFLLPEEGVRQQARSLGKGHGSRRDAEVFDEVGAVEVRTRSAAGSQDIQLYDVAQIARHFGTSRLATLYQLRNLRLVTEAELESLKVQDARHGRQVARLLSRAPSAPPPPDDRRECNEFRERFLILALEAWRREAITRDKLLSLARLVEVGNDELEALLVEMSLPLEEFEDELLLPGDRDR